MPPKKGAAKAQPQNLSSTEKNPKTSKRSQQHEAPSKKRKQTTNTNGPQKASRRSARSTPKSQPSQLQLLNYMLSKPAEELCRPSDESDDIQSRKNIRTYSSSVLNPFEELLCATILSRPISHRLGLRTIRTILNEPYNFTSAKAVRNAGEEKIYQAVWDAKTQHKGKTTEEIGRVADVVLEKFANQDDKDGTQLQKVLDESKGDVEKAVDTLKEIIKGFGNTGANIFLRRVQWLWEGGYPFVDDKTGLALRNLGLPDDAEELRTLLEKHLDSLNTENVAGEGEAARKRRAFVVALERAVGAELEGKIDALLEAAASAE